MTAMRLLSKVLGWLTVLGLAASSAVAQFGLTADDEGRLRNQIDSGIDVTIVERELAVAAKLREAQLCDQWVTQMVYTAKLLELDRDARRPQLRPSEATYLFDRYFEESKKSCREPEKDFGPPVVSARDIASSATPRPDAIQALAELEDMAARCRSGTSAGTADGARYRRFHAQVEKEIAGLNDLLGDTEDPALRRGYSERLVLLGVRLTALPEPDAFACGAPQLAAEPQAPLNGLYGDPLRDLWQVKIERIRGEPSEGRVAVWPRVDLRCEAQQGTSCIYRWALSQSGNYSVEGSATHMPYGHQGILDVILGGGTAMVTHSYFPNTLVTEELLVSSGSMTGVWRFDGELMGRSTWQRQPWRITQIGLSLITGNYSPVQASLFPAGSPLATLGYYDPFNWSAQNTARIRRPKILVNLYGTNMDGAHFVEFPQARGFEPEMSRPMYSADGTGRVIGASVLITLMPDATPGRKRMRIDGEDYWIDIGVEGHPAQPVNDN